MARTRSIRQWTLPRKPRAEVAAQWRRHALPAMTTSSSPDAGCLPAKKKARTDALLANDGYDGITVQLPPDVLVDILRLVAWLCPRTAVGCRLVSRFWREATTESSVQEVVWEQCIGERQPQNGSAEVGAKEDVPGHGDVVAALVRVEHEILYGRFHDALGYPFTGGDPKHKWLDERFSRQLELDRQSDEDLDDGMAVRGCADRKWWRAAETLVTTCEAVDHRFARPQWGRLPELNGPHLMRGTGEDAVLDAAVDAGDVRLCRALLRCPQTAVRKNVGWLREPVCQYGFGHEMHPRGDLWHSVEALRKGQIELAAMLVSPRDEGGGGQLAMPLLRALCCGDVEWTQAVMPAMDAAVRGFRAHLKSLMRTKKGCHNDIQARDISRPWYNYVVDCRNHLENLTNPEARGELQVVLDQLHLSLTGRLR